MSYSFCNLLSYTIAKVLPTLSPSFNRSPGNGNSKNNLSLPSNPLSKLSIPLDDMPGVQSRHLAWSNSIKGWWKRVGKEVLWIFWWKFSDENPGFDLSCHVLFHFQGMAYIKLRVAEEVTGSVFSWRTRFCRHSCIIRPFVRRKCWIVLWILQLQNLETISLPFKRNEMNEA